MKVLGENGIKELIMRIKNYKKHNIIKSDHIYSESDSPTVKAVVALVFTYNQVSNPEDYILHDNFLYSIDLNKYICNAMELDLFGEYLIIDMLKVCEAYGISREEIKKINGVSECDLPNSAKMRLKLAGKYRVTNTAYVYLHREPT